MKEAKAMAYVNMYGVLATLENLCQIDDEAKAVLRELKKPVSICFDVTNGPCCTFNFTQDGCKMSEGTKLTNRLTQLLMPSEADLKDRAFFEESTVLTFYTIAGAISALANTDSVSKQSALYTVDGDVSMGIKDVCYATIRVNNHTFRTIKEKAQSPRAVMEFATIDLANGLFNGTASTMAELCAGHIYMAGMISMVDNINRVLDRVAVYLG